MHYEFDAEFRCLIFNLRFFVRKESFKDENHLINRVQTYTYSLRSKSSVFADPLSRQYIVAGVAVIRVER